MANNAARIQAFTQLATFLISHEIPFTFQELGDDILIDPLENIEMSTEQLKELIRAECKTREGQPDLFELEGGVEDCFYEILESNVKSRRYAPDIRVRFRDL